MTIGENIKKIRLENHLTQKELGEKIGGISQQQIGQWETGKANPKIETVQKIAAALGVDPFSLYDSDTARKELDNCFWSSYLEDKLKQIGCRLAYDEEDAAIWIEFPDGTLEISDKELKELDDSTVSYLRFQLEELKRKHPKDFRPKRKK